MRRAVAGLVAAAVSVAGAAERAAGPTVNHFAMEYSWGSVWGGALDAIMGGTVRLDASSSQPKGFVSRLYDGNVGSLAEATGSFLIFDDARAAVRVRIPEWREVDSVAFYALEAAENSKAALAMRFAKPDAPAQKIAFKRRVLQRRGGLAHVEYRGAGAHALSGGEVFIAYQNPDFGSAFVGEVVLDGVAAGAPWADPARPGSRLLYWKHWDVPGRRGAVRLHALITKTAATGTKERDLTPAWLAHPVAAAAPVPLVVLVANHGTVEGPLELLGLAGRPEWALAPRLAEEGFAVLVVEATLGPGNLADSDAQYVARLEATLHQILDGAFARHAGVAIDRTRIGIWTSGNTAGVATLAESRARYPWRNVGHWTLTQVPGAGELRAIVDQLNGRKGGR